MSTVYAIRLSLVGIAAGIFAAAILVALDFPTMASYLPFFAAGAGLVICVGQLWDDIVLIRRWRRGSVTGTTSAGGDYTGSLSADAQRPERVDEPPYRTVVIVLLLLYLYVGAVVLFGFLVPSALMMLLTFRFRGGARWSLAILAVVLVLLGIIGITSYARIVLPDGLLV